VYGVTDSILRNVLVNNEKDVFKIATDGAISGLVGGVFSALTMGAGKALSKVAQKAVSSPFGRVVTSKIKQIVQSTIGQNVLNLASKVSNNFVARNMIESGVETGIYYLNHKNKKEITKGDLFTNYLSNLATNVVFDIAKNYTDNRQIEEEILVQNDSKQIQEEIVVVKKDTKRPTFKESEEYLYEKEDIPKDYRQIVYLDRKTTRNNARVKGSSVPEGTIEEINAAYEIKNYDINNNSSNLIKNIVGQYEKRLVNLPDGMIQNIYIDVRGQEYTEEMLEVIKNKILEKVSDKTQIKIDFYR
ncbi:MAG: hypothetical protein MR601_03655, partial [Erysipelotrichaceae bacterium]|nr:hypothetical protein [Erysipelotrichaceae bacterium]